MLMGQDLEEVPVIPAGLLALGSDAALGRGLAAEEVEGQAAQGRIDRLWAVWPVRMRLSSSRKAMSRTQWREFSIPQWLRTACNRIRASAAKLEM